MSENGVVSSSDAFRATTDGIIEYGHRAALDILIEQSSKRVERTVKEIVRDSIDADYNHELCKQQIGNDYHSVLLERIVETHPYFSAHTLAEIEMEAANFLCMVCDWSGRYPNIGLCINMTPAHLINVINPETGDPDHLDRCRAHFINRAWERFGLELSRGDYASIRNAVRYGRAYYLDDSMSGAKNERYYIEYCGVPMVVGWDAVLNIPVTAMLFDDQKHDIRKIERWRLDMMFIEPCEAHIKKIIDGLDTGFVACYEAREKREAKLLKRKARHG